MSVVWSPSWRRPLWELWKPSGRLSPHHGLLSPRGAGSGSQGPLHCAVSPDVLPVPQPPDTDWGGGQLPGHFLDHWVSLSGAQPTVRNCTEWESEKEGSLGEPGLFLLPVSLEEFQGMLTCAPLPSLPFLPIF